jgi:hypothetical protein
MEEEEDYRRSVTAEKYIREKTQLSRSGVMRILADLKTGGFIEMEEGRLIKINKLPPDTEFQTQKRPQLRPFQQSMDVNAQPPGKVDLFFQLIRRERQQICKFQLKLFQLFQVLRRRQVALIAT